MSSRIWKSYEVFQVVVDRIQVRNKRISGLVTGEYQVGQKCLDHFLSFLSFPSSLSSVSLVAYSFTR